MDRRTFFRNSEKIVKGINNAIAALSDGDDQSGAVSLAFDALSDLKVPAQHMEEARDIETQLTDAAYALQGVRDALHEALYSCAYDPSEQDEVEERIAELNKLRSRFGNTEEEILQMADKCCRQDTHTEGNFKVLYRKEMEDVYRLANK